MDSSIYLKKIFALTIGLVSVLNPIHSNMQLIQETLDPSSIEKFIEPLPTFNGRRVDGRKSLTITAVEFQQKILPASFYEQLPKQVTYKSVQTGEGVVSINPKKGTYLWGYKIFDGEKTHGPSFPATTIVAKRGIKTHVKYVNQLIPFKDKKNRRLLGPLLQKFLTVDLSYCWANPLKYPMMIQGMDPATGLPLGNAGFYNGPQPMVTHLHGSETPSYSDGYPEAWFTPKKKIKGGAYVTDRYTYPNTQPATALWFHDHVMGVTRLNTYAGLAGMYLIKGEPESSVRPPLPGGEYEIELSIADRQFDTFGQLFFPDGNPMDGGLNGTPPNPKIHPYGIPEFYGNVMTVNGKSWPYLEVEPRRYRFRMLNTSNARVYALRLANQNGGTLPPNVPAIWQIGADGGLFDKPVNIDSFIPFTWDPTDLDDSIYGSPVFNSPRLIIASAERCDIIIDFSGFEGEKLTLINDAGAPFPSGGTEFDENQALIMQFRVKKHAASKDTSFNPALPDATLRKGKNKMVRLADGKGGLAPGVVPDLTRSLILIEQADPDTGEPVTALINNTYYTGKNPITNEPIKDSVSYNDGTIFVTEIPQVGSTEVWEIINLTGDEHNIHIHLSPFQLINTQVFDVGDVDPPFIFSPSYRKDAYEAAWGPNGTQYGDGPPFPYLSTPKLGGNPSVDPYLKGPPIAPDPTEVGWKDTVEIFPGTVTRIVIRWAPQKIPVSRVKAGQNKYRFDPTNPLGGKKDAFGYPGGPGYVWHCHIVDHEDNDMMRPLQIGRKPQRK